MIALRTIRHQLNCVYCGCVWLVFSLASQCVAIADEKDSATPVEARAAFTQRLDRIVQEREPISEDSIEILTQALQDEDFRMRRRAAHVANVLSEKFRDDLRPIEPLLKAVRVEHEFNALMEMVRALGEYRDKRAVDALLLLYRKRDPFWFKEDAARESMSGDEVDSSANELLNLVCSALIKIGDPAAIPVLRKRLPEGRACVVDALLQLHDDESLPVFLEMLPREYPSTDAQRSLASAAARAVAQFADEEATERLIEALHDARSFHNVGKTLMQDYEQDLCRALGKTYDGRAVHALLNAAMTYPHDDNNFWRSTNPAIIGLAPRGRFVLPYLEQWLAAAPRDSSRQTTTIQLLESLSAAQLQPQDWDELTPLVLRLLDQVPQKQQVVLFSVVSNRCQSRPELRERFQPTVPLLLKIIQSNSDDDRSIEGAVQALGILGDESCAQAIEPLLRHGSFKVHSEAIHAVARLKHPRTLELLTPFLSDEVVALRLRAIESLRYANGPDTVQVLVDVLRRESSAEILQAASWTLALLGDARGANASTESLLKLDPRRRERSSVVACLAWLGDERNLEELKRILMSDLNADRLNLVRVLCDLDRETQALGRRRLLPQIVDAWIRDSMRDLVERRPHAITTQTAISDLRCVLDKATVDLLLAWSSSKDTPTQIAAISLLAESDDPRRIDILAQAMKIGSQRQREHLALKLRNTPDPQIVASLIDALNDEAPEVRDAALGSLGEMKVVAARERVADLAKNDRSGQVRDRAQVVLKKLAE